MMTSKPSVLIIGAGVNGLSCALHLQKHGYNVKILTHQSINNYKLTPRYSSLFPAASIIPHSVYSDVALPLFVRSNQYFAQLHHQNFPGLKQHYHYELFGYKQAPPPYVSKMAEVEFFEQFRDSFYPKHPKIPIRAGWRFTCFFADWPVYFPHLHQLFLSQGGTIEYTRLQAGDLSKLPADIIINCAGYGAAELAGDSNRLLERGHLLQIPGKTIPANSRGKTVSYNFSPGAAHYASANGHPQDVYCYPRKNGWIWGGSRLRGLFDENDRWKGDAIKKPMFSIEEKQIPKTMYKLNADIMAHTFEVEIPPIHRASLSEGYRYIRKTKNGLRLQAEEARDKLIIHNYGHGGAGVTLSWGCAVKVLELIQQHT